MSDRKITLDEALEKMFGHLPQTIENLKLAGIDPNSVPLIMTNLEVDFEDEE